MSQFSVSSVPELKYDFTGIRSNDGKTFCKGSGVIPEPTQKEIEGYSQAIRELFSISKDDSVEKAIESAEKSTSEEDADAKSKTLLELTATLCENNPSYKELDALPPRYRTGFMKWIHQELSNPEVSSAGTHN